MKRTFWTRNLFIGVLMGLVMAFSAPETADAITRFTISSGDLQLHAPGDTFTVRFSVGLQSASRKSGFKQTPSGSVDTSIGTTTYYEDTGDSGYQTETQVLYAAAHNYDQEAINIAVTGGTLTKVGSFDVTGAAHTMTEGGTGAARLTSSVTLTLTATAAGTVEIDITDTTASDDRPSGATAATQLDITVYIAPTHDDTSTIALAASPGAVGFSIAEEQINDDFSGLTDVRVNYAVSGSGAVSVKVGDRVLTGKNLTTSSAAPVYLIMGGSTNKVTASVVGQRPDRAASVTYIYSHAILTKESGDKQKGAVSSRLANPLVVRVVDGKTRTVSGVEINFVAAGGGSFVRNPNFPLNRYVPETDESITYGRIKTDSSGQAQVFWVLGDSGDQTATATLTGSTAIQANSLIFTATFGTTTSTPSSIAIKSGDGQHADEFGLLEDPLVVVVRDQRGQLVNGETVRFIARDGGTLDPPSGDDPGESTDGGTSSDIIEDVDTNSSGEASVRYTPPDGGGRRTVSASLQDNPTKLVTFTVNGAPSTSGGSGDDDDDDDPPPTTITRVLDIDVSGSGSTREVTVTALQNGVSQTGIFINLTVTGSGASLSRTSGGTPLESTLTLPTGAGTYTLRASTTASGYSAVTEDVTITVPGTLTISPISTSTGAQTVTVTARRGGSLQGDVNFTISGSGIVPARGITTATGNGNAILNFPRTGTYSLTVSADGYDNLSVSVTISTTGQQQQQQTQQTTTPTTTTTTGTAGVADSIQISGQVFRTGTVNTPLDQPLSVRVLDGNERGVENVKVTFRLQTGQGRLSQRGNGKGASVRTDRSGYARAPYTPLARGTSRVRAEAAGVTQTVTFTITVNGASDPETDTGAEDAPRVTDDTPRSREINPVVQVNAENRPPMLWVDSGKIYALVGAEVQAFISGVEGAMNIAVSGNKVYWTEQTGESAGTINSANLDGSDVKELKAIMAVPMGIAVDTANSKLYWTNSRGRIQSLNADGSGRVENVLQNLSGPMDIAIGRSNLYWTEYDATAGAGNVGIANSAGSGTPKYISTGSDMPGSLVIAGTKVYWTEMTGTSAGTINSATLSGTDVKQLASIRAVPVGIAVDSARSKLFWTNSRGRIQSANLDGSRIQNVVDGLGMPGDMVLSNSIKAPTEAPEKSTTTAAGKSKYDINGDGTVDDTDIDALIIAMLAGVTSAKYDVNGDGTVDVDDVKAVRANQSAGAASAPTLLGRKFSALEVQRLQEQIDLLIASGDRSPAAMKTLIYLQQLIAMARPEKTQLLANYPNPFNPETWMPYELATDTDVRITIYNAQGVVVRVLSLGHQSAGYYTDRERTAYWDGRNALGEQVASGIYFYQLETDTMSALRKMVILK